MATAAAQDGARTARVVGGTASQASTGPTASSTKRAEPCCSTARSWPNATFNTPGSRSMPYVSLSFQVAPHHRCSRRQWYRAVRGQVSQWTIAGSACVELVLLTPVFILLLFFVVVAGRLAVSRNQIDGAARDAAREASTWRSATDATIHGVLQGLSGTFGKAGTRPAATHR